LVAGGACAVTLIRQHSNVYTALIVALIFGLLGIGFIGKGSGNAQAYVQIAQVLIFGTIVSTQRSMRIGSTVFLSVVALVAAVIALNFIWPAPVERDDTHNFTQSVGIFGNPNTLAICLTVLFFFVFAFSLVAPTIRHRIAGYAVAGCTVYLLAATGSRSGLLALALYLGVIALGRFLKGDKRILRFVGAAILLFVPVVIISYPMIFGQHIRFVAPAPESREVSAGPFESPILSEPTCVKATLADCKGGPLQRPEGEPEPGQMNDGGLLGINKSFASGRQIIWPAVIELSGENVFFGHGLGTLPGAYLAWPYNGRSAHNGFLQVYYQFGVVGLLLYVSIWVAFFVRASNISNRGARSVAVATLCATCFLETFEVVLIQNQFGIGVAFALLMTTEFVGTSNPNTVA
jgi:O-antigen ligase